jgi:hypothetical protein
MLVSVNKNKWLYDWMRDQWQSEIYDIIANDPQQTPRPNTIKRQMANLLTSKGYQSRVTTRGDIILSMKDEEYTFLALKYMGE